MDKRKKTHINSSNKHIIREFLIQRFQFESVDGMTFEGNPKKIILHSDHFKIYF